LEQRPKPSTSSHSKFPSRPIAKCIARRRTGE